MRVNRMIKIVYGLIGVLAPAVAFAQTPKCEEQLPIAQKLLQSVAQQRSQYEIENAQLRVQVEQIIKELAELRVKSGPNVEKK